MLGGSPLTPLLLISALLVGTAPPPAPLFQPGDGEAQAFKAAFERGETYFVAGDYGAAAASFREADRRRVTPEVAFDLAKCHEKLGDVALATSYYRLYLLRAPTAPDALEVAELVATALSKAAADGRGLLELDAPEGTALTVASRRYHSAPVAVFLPAGEYVLTGVFPSGPQTKVVQVLTGQVTSARLEPLAPPLVPLDQALTEAMVTAGLTAPQPAAAPPASALRVGGYVVAGLGLAALAAGVLSGALAATDAARATDRSLPVSQAVGFARQANGEGLAANVLFGVGGVGVAGGALMYLFSMPEPGLKATR